MTKSLLNYTIPSIPEEAMAQAEIVPQTLPPIIKEFMSKVKQDLGLMVALTALHVTTKVEPSVNCYLQKYARQGNTYILFLREDLYNSFGFPSQLRASDAASLWRCVNEIALHLPVNRFIHQAEGPTDFKPLDYMVYMSELGMLPGFTDWADCTPYHLAIVCGHQLGLRSKCLDLNYETSHLSTEGLMALANQCIRDRNDRNIRKGPSSPARSLTLRGRPKPYAPERLIRCYVSLHAQAKRKLNDLVYYLHLFDNNINHEACSGLHVDLVEPIHGLTDSSWSGMERDLPRLAKKHSVKQLDCDEFVPEVTMTTVIRGLEKIGLEVPTHDLLDISCPTHSAILTGLMCARRGFYLPCDDMGDEIWLGHLYNSAVRQRANTFGEISRKVYANRGSIVGVNLE